MCVLLKYKVRTIVKRIEAVVNPDRYSASVKHATEKHIQMLVLQSRV